jgi:hypothetical protein
MTDRSPETLELVLAGRRDSGPGDARRFRNRARLLARVGAGAAMTSAASASAAVVKSGAGAVSLAAKIAVGAVVFSVAGMSARAVFVRSQESEHFSPELTAAPVAAEPAAGASGFPPPSPSASAAPEPPAPAPPAGASAHPRRAAPASNARDAEPSFESDVQLLREVDAALRAGRADAALRMLDERTIHGSAGALAQERAAARVLALCALGRKGEVRAASSSFLREWPDSPLAPRVASTCEAAAPSAPSPTGR